MENAMLKIRMLLPQEVDVSLERAVEAVSFHVDPLRGEEVEVAQNYRILVEAMEQRRAVDMEYYTASRDAHTSRRIEPYHLRLVGGAWYCIAYCQKRREVRTFALDRMESLSVTNERFEIPAKFSITEYLGYRLDYRTGHSHAGSHRVRFKPGSVCLQQTVAPQPGTRNAF